MLQRYVFFHYIPLQLFVLLIRFFRNDWSTVFIISGSSALLFLMILLRQKNSIDRFVLAVYCFLIGGAVMFLLNITWLQLVYKYFNNTMLLVWLVIVGVFSSIMTEVGFIGVKSVDKQKQRLYSYYLVVATIIGLIITLYNKENVFFAAMLSFLSLRILQVFLKKLLIKKK